MNKLIIRILIASLVAFGLFIYLYFSETAEFPVLLHNLDILLWYILAWNLVAWLVLIISEKLNLLLSWKNNFGKRYFAGLFSFLLAGYFLIGLFGLLYFLFPNHEHTLSDFLNNNNNVVIKLMITTGFLLFIYTLIDLSYYSYRQYAIEHIEAIRLEREQLSLQYAALKKQLSPHFLFNSLNTASSLLYRDVQKSETFVRKLANSYSSILDSVNQSLITLTEELRIVEDYKFLMEVRFENSLSINVNIPESYKKTKIPPLCLQLLVENALKHNLISEKKPLIIDIYIEEPDYIIVSNSYNEKTYYVQVENKLIEDPEHKSTKVGLENIKKRYSFYTSSPVTIEKHSDRFTVGLPVLSIKDEG